MITRPGETLNHRLGRASHESVAKVRQFLRVHKVGMVVDGDLELFPEDSPVQNIAIKQWHIKLR